MKQIQPFVHYESADSKLKVTKMKGKITIETVTLNRPMSWINESGDLCEGTEPADYIRYTLHPTGSTSIEFDTGRHQTEEGWYSSGLLIVEEEYGGTSRWRIEVDSDGTDCDGRLSTRQDYVSSGELDSDNGEWRRDSSEWISILEYQRDYYAESVGY